MEIELLANLALYSFLNLCILCFLLNTYVYECVRACVCVCVFILYKLQMHPLRECTRFF